MSSEISDLPKGNLSRIISDLLQRQISYWPLASANYEGLNNVKVRSIACNGFEVRLQYNPHRIISSSAKVDDESIKNRSCFLCPLHLPNEQEWVAVDEKFQILVNPYPIFKQHLTIPTKEHIPQRIEGSLCTMLQLSQKLPEFVIFYNGPKCGASAPDHMHFQAGNKGFLPIESDFEKKTWVEFVGKKEGVNVYSWNNYLRTVLTFESSDLKALEVVLKKTLTVFSTRQDEPEPMINIVSYLNDDTIIVHLFPRQKHRPSHYFKDNNDRILISPASVDMGGVIVTPREEDFNKLSQTEIIEIFKEVSMPCSELDGIIKQIIA